MYGILNSALLFYCKLWGDLHAKGSTINPYNPCVANKDIGGLQMTTAWHVDNRKMSDKSPQVVTGVIEWLRGIYGELCISHGKKHEYLGIDIDYSAPGNVTFGMEKMHLQHH